MTKDQQQELEQLLSQLIDGSLDDAGRERLGELVQASTEARRLYLEHCQMHAMLQAQHGLLGGETRPAEVAAEDRSQRATGRWRLFLAAAALFAILIAVLPALQKATVSGGGAVAESAPSRGPVAATFYAISGPRFVYGVDGGTVRPGQGVPSGRYQMRCGLIELAFEDGGRAIVEGPADFTLEGNRDIRLDSGRLVIRTQGGEAGFTVRSENLEITDIGTIFAVDVPDDVTAEVHVFEGEVLVKTVDDDGLGHDAMRIQKGMALRIFRDTGVPAGIELAEDRYIQYLDDPDGPYSRRILELRPLVYFPMRPSQDGHTLLDASGNGLHAEVRGLNLPGAVLWTPGKIGKAIRLAGPNPKGYALVPEYPRLSNNTFSCVAWVYAESRPTWATIMKNWASAKRGQFHFGLFESSGVLEGHINDVSRREIFVREGVPLPLHEWHHVAFVADGTFLRLYRNGEQVAHSSYTEFKGDPALKALGIGTKLRKEGDAASPSIQGSIWHGKLDEIALFDYALTPEQIAGLYQIGNGGSVTALGLNTLR